MVVDTFIDDEPLKGTKTLKFICYNAPTLGTSFLKLDTLDGSARSV